MTRFLFKLVLVAVSFVIVGKGIDKYMDEAKSKIEARQARIIAADWK